MAKKKTVKEKYEAARESYRKNLSEASKKKFLAARQEYIEQRQKDKSKGKK